MHPLRLLPFTFLPSLISTALTASSALSLAPAVLEHHAKLEDALNDYKNVQVQIAAIKLKSLLPTSTTAVSDPSQVKVKVSLTAKASADSSDSDSNDSDSDSNDGDESDSDVDDVPTADILLSTSLAQLLKSLDPAGLTQIASFDFAFQSVEDFVAAKEREAVQKLRESLTAIRDIQRVLQITGGTVNDQNINAKLIARLVAKLDALQEEYEDVHSLQKRLKSSKEEKRIKAQKDLANAQVKIQKLIQSLSEIISE